MQIEAAESGARKPGGSAVSRLVERIQEMIAERRLSFGDPLPTERDLAQQFGASRNTVREALQYLRAYGIVDIKPKAGAVLANRHSDAMSSLLTLHHAISPASFREVQGFRKVVETGAGEAALLTLTEAQLADLDAANLRILDSATVAEAAEADYAFHEKLVGLAGNAVLLASYRHQRQSMLELMRLGKETRFVNEETWREHKSIVEALRAKDRIAYAYLLSRHLEYGMRFVRPEADREE
ncbi:GntR family transcriptional regulator [Rhizobium sp. FKL33]|uniref:FadR/GntR family transcriptional regulator n=1 Tax=Rhizobium sp. FKL33 TaxID=2562307 RepID=UPI00148577A7|nr:GntR family transcriptional regulator [Rhizobium sp. FKL33]